MLLKFSAVLDGKSRTKNHSNRKFKANLNHQTSYGKRRSISRNYKVGEIAETVGVNDERNYSQSDSRLICASTGTSKSLILGRCYANEDSDQDDEFFTYTEVTGSLLVHKTSLQSENPEGNSNKKLLTVQKKSYFPFRRSLFPGVPPYVFFHSDECTCFPFPKIISRYMKWKLNPWTPPIVRRIVEASGFRVITGTDSISSESWCGTWENIFPKNWNHLTFYQKVNHFPGTFKLGHKDQLWTSINEMIKKFGRKHFGFIPSTYILPRDKHKLKRVWTDDDKTKWIIKPPSSGCGAGVHVVHQWWEIPTDTYVVVQRYLVKPKLIDGAKFDLRLYVLVTSFDPLKVYLYSDGLVRIATTKYNLDVKHHKNRFMHLTNTSVNKYNKSYKLSSNINSATGHLWSLKSLWSLLEKESVNIPKLWSAMKDIVIKTLISVESMIDPIVQRTLTSRYTCFELFGFDILIEEDLKPWLLEVNTVPSLRTDSAVHRAIKGPLVRTILNIAGYQIYPGIPNSVLSELTKRYQLDYLCQNYHLYNKILTHESTRKHFNYMYHSNREEYLDTILENLTSDDVRNLITFEDEFTQLELFEKIFPTNETHSYHKYFSKPRYYDMLLDAWEHTYGSCRNRGIRMLQNICRTNYHLMS